MDSSARHKLVASIDQDVFAALKRDALDTELANNTPCFLGDILNKILRSFYQLNGTSSNDTTPLRRRGRPPRNAEAAVPIEAAAVRKTKTA